ncbi:hypothetical protein Presley_26 [Acinetobacter phage Presley]|uniref:Uncharacterized protein n=1 Tax=Acinetobacter phage Presley TaxID=1406780 RepID=U5PZV3_9CAUD|nr:hypothetical protein Presley_26 [Acinetobacter phage Presley]AGY48093.1 hypothetical protein Presley_26 [Acinetobacter phage Presley]
MKSTPVFIRGVKLIKGVPACDIHNVLTAMHLPSAYFNEAMENVLRLYKHPDDLVYGTLYIFALNDKITFTKLNERGQYGTDDVVKMPEYTTYFVVIETYPELIAKGRLLGAKI